MITPTTATLTENDIVDAVVDYLTGQGWTIVSTARTNQSGVDVLACIGGRTLAVEAKGGGSSKAWTRRAGKPFTPGQKEDHVARAVLTALKVTSRGEHEAAIAFPDDPQHARLLASVAPSLGRADIAVYLVAADRSVRTV